MKQYCLMQSILANMGGKRWKRNCRDHQSKDHCKYPHRMVRRGFHYYHRVPRLFDPPQQYLRLSALLGINLLSSQEGQPSTHHYQCKVSSHLSKMDQLRNTMLHDNDNYHRSLHGHHKSRSLIIFDISTVIVNICCAVTVGTIQDTG